MAAIEWLRPGDLWLDIAQNITEVTEPYVFPHKARLRVDVGKPVGATGVAPRSGLIEHVLHGQ